MTKFETKIDALPAGVSVSTTLTLPFEKRQKSRLRAVLDDGSEAAVLLERGAALRHGDLLIADDGRVIQVQAAPESVSVLRHDDPLALARAAYHLGNRHVSLQIERGLVSYLHDHVLDEMVTRLVGPVAHETRPFEPESGAYGSGHAGGHGHSHSHSNSHGDSNEHSHPHPARSNDGHTH